MNITDLREKCQSSRRACDTWHGRNIARKLSIYITVVFINLRIGAMAATTIFLFSGIVACLTFFVGTRIAFLVGALILQLWYILDHVDGEVARYNEESSLTGLYYDELSHYIVHPLVFFSIGFGLFRITGDTAFIMIGFLAGFGIALLSLVVDLKKLVALEYAKGSSSATESVQTTEQQGGSLVRFVFSKFHIFCTFPFIMNVITVSSLIDVITKLDTIIYVLTAYAVVINFVWILKLIVFINKRSVDLDV